MALPRVAVLGGPTQDDDGFGVEAALAGDAAGVAEPAEGQVVFDDLRLRVPLGVVGLSVVGPSVGDLGRDGEGGVGGGGA